MTHLRKLVTVVNCVSARTLQARLFLVIKYLINWFNITFQFNIVFLAMNNSIKSLDFILFGVL